MRDTRFGRALTTGERGLASSVLGPVLDLSSVRLTPARLPFQPRGVVMAPWNTVWLGGAYHEDFAGESTPLRALLLHELTHCSQYQAGMDLIGRGAWVHLAAFVGRRSAYDYALDRTPLRRRPFEHQAAIVEDAYRLANDTPPRRAGARLGDLLASLGHDPDRASFTASLSLGAPPLLNTPLR